jgi:hypothetical protein
LNKNYNSINSLENEEENIPSNSSLVINNFFIADKILEDKEEKKSYFYLFILKIYNSLELNKMNIFKKIHFFIIEAFWVFLRNITIFKANENDWNKYRVCLVPIFFPFVLMLISIDNYFYLLFNVIPVLAILVLIGIIISIILFLITNNKKHPRFFFVKFI